MKFFLRFFIPFPVVFFVFARADARTLEAMRTTKDLVVQVWLCSWLYTYKSVR